MKGEVRYTAEGNELRHGSYAWTRRLVSSAAVRGEQIRERYGCYAGFERTADRVKLTDAARDCRCSDCDARIDRGDLHGGTLGIGHYCLNCVTPIRPEPEFRET